MDAGKLHLISEADYVLSKCGRKVLPEGSVVYIPKGFLLQAYVPVTSSQTFYKEITGDTVWCWRSISVALSATPPAVSAQVLKPDGHFLFNGLLDLAQVGGFGSGRYVLTNEIVCPPGSKIQISFNDAALAAAVAQGASILCGGAYAYYLKNGVPSQSPEEDASQLPKVFATPNQNILAPFWMTGEAEVVPEGMEAEPFTYGDGTTNVFVATVGSTVSGSLNLPMDADSDFRVKRFLVDIVPDAGVSAGEFLARIRSGSGYAFTDDYIDLARFIGSTYFAKAWDVKRGDQINVDLLFVDGAGAGNCSITVYADGVKLRKKAA